jgi:hypothetical protein
LIAVKTVIANRRHRLQNQTLGSIFYL